MLEPLAPIQEILENGAERFQKRVLKARFERLKLVLYVMQAKRQQQRLTAYNYRAGRS